MITGSLVKCERCDGNGVTRDGDFCRVCMSGEADAGLRVVCKAGTLPLPVHPDIALKHPEWVTQWTRNENEENDE